MANTDVEGALLTEDGTLIPLGKAEFRSFRGAVLSLTWAAIRIGHQGWTRALLARVGEQVVATVIERQELTPGCLFTGICDVTIRGLVGALPDDDPLLLSGKQW